MKINNRFITTILSVAAVFLLASTTMRNYYRVKRVNYKNNDRGFKLLFSEIQKKCFEKYPSEVVQEKRPFRFFVHPRGTDLIISSSILGNGGSTEKFFESHIRQQMLNALNEVTSIGSSSSNPGSSINPGSSSNPGTSESGNNYPSNTPVILDIGANIGLHTLFFAAAGYEVHAFEPLPLNYEILECSLVTSQFERVFLNKFALSTKPSNSSCMTVEHLNIGHSVIANNQTISSLSSSSSSPCTSTGSTNNHNPNPNPNPNNNAVVTIKRLDAYLKSHLPGKSPDLIKIDVEGHEFMALESAKSHFQAFGPPKHIFSEFCPSFIKAAGSNPLDYLEFLWDLGLRVEVGNEIVTKRSTLYQNLIDPDNGNIYDIHAIL